MLPRTGYRSLLLRFLERTRQTGWGALVWFSVAASVSLFGQQVDAPAAPGASGGIVSETQHDSVISQPEEPPAAEVNPAAVLQPAWVITTDSDGNLRQRIKLESDFAAGSRSRVGLTLGEGFISNAQSSSGGHTESVRDLGITGQWLLGDMLKLEGMFGVSQLGASVASDGQAVGQAFIPVANVQAHLSPSEIIKLDLGFERFVFDLSPQIVANRVVRNQFSVRPEFKLHDGWRFRALAEMGPITSVGESNARYNSEFTVGHKLGKASELYSTYSMLHYAQSSDAGYFSPDLAQNFEGGWSSDIDRKAFSLSLDVGLGAGHAKEHGSSFGPWGVSGHLGSFFTWTVRDGRDLSASYEYYYDQSNPAVESNPAEAALSHGAWHMSVVSVSFRWATR